ncbi:ATP-binding protein [Streptomyces sp. LMG1-1-1.1]|uniref:ATP-binding protein n=1 Tax=Streptomyces sp. LMG1-1-1.1 TaxID=3135245 RepID=UPI0039C939DB
MKAGPPGQLGIVDFSPGWSGGPCASVPQSCAFVVVESGAVARSCDCLAHRSSSAGHRPNRAPPNPSDESEEEWAVGRKAMPDPYGTWSRAASRGGQCRATFRSRLLGLILAEEPAVRDDRRFRQGLRLSKLPHHKILEAHDFTCQPELEPDRGGSLGRRL